MVSFLFVLAASCFPPPSPLKTNDSEKGRNPWPPATARTNFPSARPHRSEPCPPARNTGVYRSQRTRPGPRDASTFAHIRHPAILRRVRTPSPKFTPNWKELILVSPDWPDNLTIPQDDPLTEDSEPLQSSTCTSERWVWELWRHPDGHCYFLKVWSQDEADPENPDTPGAALTVMEAFQFLLHNWMPRDVIADLIFEHPDMVRSLNLPPASPGLN